ncbi:MAG: BatD family protein, partial [Sedimenticolaceae bacterium]
MQARSAKHFCISGLLTGLLALILSMPAAADVRARLDRDKVYVGDPVTLVIERSGASSGEPDLSPLNKDFRVLGTGTSTQFSFVNGRSSNRTTWTVQLGPLQEGKLRIPPIQVGAEQTAALELEVTEIPEQLAVQQSEQLFLEAEVDAGDHAYVQQQIPYT